jgi:hypothetical protein
MRTLREIKVAHREFGGHFFDKETKEFFNSRIFENTYGLGTSTLFITSERFDQDAPIGFTVRESRRDGSIVTLGDFQQHATKQDAMTAASKIGRVK